MGDFISDVISNIEKIFSDFPELYFIFFISTSFFILTSVIKTFCRLISCSDSFDFIDLFISLGRWIKNKFIDLLKLFVPFETLYSWGLARIGIDYVECETQLCSECPFRDSCTSPARSAGKK